MNRRVVLLALGLAITVVAFVLAFGAVPGASTDYLIRVTSGTPGEEIRFDAAVLLKNADATLQQLTRRTPFELRSTGTAASAMFRAHGDGSIQVELVSEQAGKQVSRSTATGRAVVVGDNVVQELSGFITSF